MNKYSSKVEIYKSKGCKKENISMILLLSYMMVMLLFISLFVIVTWYKLITPIIDCKYVCYIYLTSVYGSSNNKKVQVLEKLFPPL